MEHRTPLYGAHLNLGAKIVDFGGWDMPLHYGSQIEEHHAVRRRAGMFDVSHMTIVDVEGDDAEAYLRYLLANDVAKLDAPGKALYSAMLNEAGGVVDDLIAYRRSRGFRVVVNSATREKDVAWMRKHAAAYSVGLAQRDDLAIIAVQGPDAVDCYVRIANWPDVAALSSYTALEHGDVMVSRTGYTGEDGVEVVLPGTEAETLWTRLLDAGVKPAGLAARDTARLEAGLNLYGQDMDETVSPLESRIGWTVAWEPSSRDFVGRKALEAQRAAGVTRKLTGLVLETRGVMRHAQAVYTSGGEGIITSGIFSPTLGRSIALARVPRTAKGRCEVDIRSRLQPARIVKPPFVRHGRSTVD